MAGLKASMLATAAPETSGGIDRRSGKPKRITPKIRKAVRLLLDGSCRTLKAAAEQVGVSAEYISRALRQPHVLAYVDEQARARLAAGKLLATSRLLELIHATSEHVSFDAAAHALAINGIRPVGDSPIVSVNVSPGYVVDISSDPREALAANHPLAQLRTIEGHGDVTPAPALPEPPSGGHLFSIVPRAVQVLMLAQVYPAMLRARMEMAAKRKRFFCSFATGASGLALSSTWMVWSAKNQPDLYLAVRGLGDLKATIHCPRAGRPDWWRRYSFDSNARGEVARVVTERKGGRHLLEWRGASLAPGYTLEWNINIRGRSLKRHPTPATPGTVLLPSPTTEQSLEVAVLLGPSNATSGRYPREEKHGQLERRPGRRLKTCG